MGKDNLENKISDKDLFLIKAIQELMKRDPIFETIPSKEELYKDIQNERKSEQAKKNKRKEYFCSEEFNQLIEIISKYDEIDEESLRYEFKIIEGLSAEKFKEVCKTVYHNLESEVVIQDKKSYIKKSYIDYEGIRFNRCLEYWTTKPEKS